MNMSFFYFERRCIFHGEYPLMHWGKLSTLLACSTRPSHKYHTKDTNQVIVCCLWYRALLFNLGFLHFPSDEIRKDIEEQAEFQKQQMIAASQVIDPYNDPGNTLINMTTQGNHDNLESLDVNDFIQHFIQKNYSKLVNWVVTRNCLV